MSAIIEKLEPVYMDQDGYNHYLKQIDELKEAINLNNMGRSEAYDAGAGDGWDSPEFEEIERTNSRLNGQLNYMLSVLARVVIIDKHNNDSIIDIGDVILADITSSPEKTEEMKFKLVGANADFFAEVHEISINSPMGKAVYKKKIGDTCSYSVNNRNFSVLIKQKIDAKKEEHDPAKQYIK